MRRGGEQETLWDERGGEGVDEERALERKGVNNVILYRADKL